MKYPTSIIVKRHTYTIEYVPTKREVDGNLVREDLVGQAFYSPEKDRSGTIRVFCDQETSAIIDTLVHEILHAIFAHNNMLAAAIKHGMDEPFIDTLATELMLVLLENGFITAKGKPPLTERILDRG
jgi:hypothetical protein